MEMRLEDYGKMALQNVPTLPLDKIKEVLGQFFVSTMGTRNYILLSKDIGYYTVFQVKSPDPIKNFIDYLDNSYFRTEQDVHLRMNEINYIENNNGNLELWINKTYFQLSPFDWGIETL